MLGCSLARTFQPHDALRVIDLSEPTSGKARSAAWEILSIVFKSLRLVKPTISSSFTMILSIYELHRIDLA